MAAERSLIVVDLERPRFDQSTFYGRLRHFMQITDPRVCLVNESKLQRSLSVLSEYRARGCPPIPAVEAKTLWDAKKVQDAILHPDTHKKILLPFRLSAFVPVNIMICAGMLTPHPTVKNIIFWQWINQTYNIALNHANRNASNDLSNSQIAKTYAAAVGVSCTVAVGLGQLARLPSLSTAVRATMQRLVPFTAVATAGICNVFMMRSNELTEGIVVKDVDGNQLGKSPAAGFTALSMVSLSRILTACPCLILPPLIVPRLLKMPFFASRPRMHGPVNLAVITAMLLTGLPIAVAIFPQNVSVPVEKLEPEFRGLTDQSGKPITEVWYNRGL
eukprot:TRINITY_DN1611_c0_g2_i1.p1 TRINITY_DN1611_c0_g2~~TRINITY_DN1611_c0_g2_i1.p1  ORF type:complete len:332 (-),score=88.34 TRINITY_DN1611_c0_g2_i1:901-1896(-)